MAVVETSLRVSLDDSRAQGERGIRTSRVRADRTEGETNVCVAHEDVVGGRRRRYVRHARPAGKTVVKRADGARKSCDASRIDCNGVPDEGGGIKNEFRKSHEPSVPGGSSKNSGKYRLPSENENCFEN